MSPLRKDVLIAVSLLAVVGVVPGCGGSKREAVPVDEVVAARLEADFVGRCDALRLTGAPEEVSGLAAWCPVPTAGANAAAYYESAFLMKDPDRRLMALLQAGGVAEHRYPVDWSDTERTLMVPYAFTEGMLDAGRFLALAAHHAVIQDEPVQAVQALVAAYRMVRHAAQDPFFINQTSRNACQRSATLGLVYALRHLELAESQLVELQEVVTGAYQPDALPRAWFVEKALAKGRDPFGDEALRYYYDDARALSQLRLAWTALAVERYRKQHASPPEQLGALVPAFLGAVPMDPFSAEPVRYATDQDGFVVFCVGGMGTPPDPEVPLDSYDATQQTAVYVPFLKRPPKRSPAGPTLPPTAGQGTLSVDTAPRQAV